MLECEQSGTGNQPDRRTALNTDPGNVPDQLFYESTQTMDALRSK